MNFSKKCISALLAAVCLCSAFAGCSGSKDSTPTETKSTEPSKTGFFKKLPGKLSDDALVCANQANITFIKDIGTSSDYRFDVITSKPLKESDVKVKIDTRNTYSLSVDDSVETKSKFPKELCLKYNGIDSAEYESNMDEIDKEYDSLSDDLFPTFCTTRCIVKFDVWSIVQPHDITEFKVTVKDKSYDVKVGNIHFTTNPISKEMDDNVDLGIASRPFYVDLRAAKDEILEIPEISLVTANDVTIKDFTLMNNDPDLTIEKVRIDGKEWKKGEDIKVKNGSKMKLAYDIKLAPLETTPNYTNIVYMEIKYESDGKEHTNYVSTLCVPDYDPQTLYAFYNDKV